MSRRPAALLDANLLIALVIAEHEHHEAATAWLADRDGFVLCPVVEGALVRFLVRTGESHETAAALLSALRLAPGHRFASDDLSYGEVDLASVRGHRQVTDTYLAALAVHHGLVLATLDSALAERLPTACELVGR